MPQPLPADSSSAPLRVLFISGDLVFASRVRSAAQAAEREFSFSGRLPETLDRVRWIVVDLSTRSSVAAEVVQEARRRQPEAQLIAYGPHVQVDRLEAARQAGYDVVLVRGQFDRQLPTLFRSDPEAAEPS